MSRVHPEKGEVTHEGIGHDLEGQGGEGSVVVGDPRLTLALEDKPGALFGILKVIADHKVNVISVVSPSFLVEGKRVAAIRIETEMYESLLKIWKKPVIRYYPLANGHPYENHQTTNSDQEEEVRS
jgi:hypothetical protein